MESKYAKRSQKTIRLVLNFRKRLIKEIEYIYCEYKPHHSNYMLVPNHMFNTSYREGSLGTKKTVAN